MTVDRRTSVLLAACLGWAMSVEGADVPLELREGWAIQSSAQVKAGGEAISKPGYSTGGWHRATVPTTVVAALVADGTYPDPHFGTNLRAIPGTSYEIGANFSNLPMPDDSPFRVPWWYRTEFTVPAAARGKTLWLRFGGINFRSNMWLNGRRLADADETAGAFRIHELDVTGIARPGEANALAVEVFAPQPNDLAITFVDWNPMPPDKVMGLYRPVTFSASGPVALRHPLVVTKLNPPAVDRAELTVRVFARNATKAEVRGTLRGAIGDIAFSQDVTLAGGESREIVFSPAAFPALVVKQPKLWWPVHYGPANLHDVELEFLTGGEVSDRAVARFGIREFTAAIDAQGHLVFKVNGKSVLIRGAGWTSEMMLRYTRERDEAEIRYVKHMGLNTIRLEGKLEDEHFFDIADREGILVMPGWCCCDHWEKWEEWKDEDLKVAVASLRDQILRLRGRASVFVWLNGSDGPPAAKVEKAYLDVLEELGFPNPIVSSATEKVAELSGPSGVKMRGPYEYVPPIYWYTDTKLGGPHGFATEIGPGPAPPRVESLKRFLPPDKLWPINEAWEFHCGGGEFRTLGVMNEAMKARYGEARSLEEYALKAQVMAYESHRAMLESFGERKYTATGVIQWMLNNAWPGMIWHLYDYYLRPGGSFFGAKKACEPVHVQYAYDDRSVVVVNSTLQAFPGMKVTARVVDLSGAEKHSRTETVDIAPDASVKVFALPEPAGLTPTYFVHLSLADASGGLVSRNVYWLSTKPEDLDWDKTAWYFTPIRDYADLTALNTLPTAEVKASARFETSGAEGRAEVVLENPSKALAFFVHLAVRKGPGGEEVLPVFWDDNDVTLLPGERVVLGAAYALKDLGTSAPAITVEGWNVAPTVADSPRGR